MQKCNQSSWNNFCWQLGKYIPLFGDNQIHCFSFVDNEIGQGRDKVKTALKEDKKIKNKIEKQVKAYLGL